MSKEVAQAAEVLKKKKKIIPKLDMHLHDYRI